MVDLEGLKLETELEIKNVEVEFFLFCNTIIIQG